MNLNKLNHNKPTTQATAEALWRTGRSGDTVRS